MCTTRDSLSHHHVCSQGRLFHIPPGDYEEERMLCQDIHSCQVGAKSAEGHCCLNTDNHYPAELERANEYGTASVCQTNSPRCRCADVQPL